MMNEEEEAEEDVMRSRQSPSGRPAKLNETMTAGYNNPGEFLICKLSWNGFLLFH
jgi:hypothetical protein